MKISLSFLSVLLFLALIPFSHAPSLITPLFTLSNLATLFLLVSLVNSRTINNALGNLLPLTVIFICFVLYLFVNALLFYDTPKLISYLVVYLFMSSAIVVLTASEVNFSVKHFRSVLFFIVLLLIVFTFIEAYYTVRNLGYIPWLPRADREVYLFHSPFGFRLRSFSYESTNYSYLLNVVYLMLSVTLFGQYKRYRLPLLIVFLILHFTALSSLQLSLFILIVSVQFFIGGFFSVRVFVCGVSLISIFTVLYSDELLNGFELIMGKFSSFIGQSNGSQSGNFRKELLENGLQLINQSPLLGEGLSSFYNYQDSGFNNFYIQTIQQLGVIGSSMFFMILLIPVIISKNKSINYKLSWFVTMVTLFFNGDIWMPQIYLTFFVLNGLRLFKDSNTKVYG